MIIFQLSTKCPRNKIGTNYSRNSIDKWKWFVKLLQVILYSKWWKGQIRCYRSSSNIFPLFFEWYLLEVYCLQALASSVKSNNLSDYPFWIDILKKMEGVFLIMEGQFDQLPLLFLQKSCACLLLKKTIWQHFKSILNLIPHFPAFQR
jgi:hypothetical protein